MCGLIPKWLAKLPPQHSDEKDLLADLTTRRENSRLSCQIRFTEELAGLKLRIADDE